MLIKTKTNLWCTKIKKTVFDIFLHELLLEKKLFSNKQNLAEAKKLKAQSIQPVKAILKHTQIKNMTAGLA